jgi:cysteine desulfurase
MFALSSHKLYAPKGCGVLALTKEYELKQFRLGGNQENGLFPGTENTPSISAFAKSVEYLSINLKSEIARLKTLTDEGLKILQSLPYKIIIESPENRAAGILCLSLPEVKEIEPFMDFLYLKGICISRFSACSENEKAASEILTAMGCPVERAEKSIRISTGIYSKREDYYALADAINEYFRTENR